MTMQETIINQELANLDLSKVAALQHKRTLAFVNHFVTTTVQFLNSFMKKCEQKLMQFERKIEKVEASMVLLEARLSSIPEANTIDTKQTVTLETKTTDNAASPQYQEPESVDNSSIEEDNPVQANPEYDRFIKMVQVGVPLQAVKLKVSLEGLDPSVLEKLLGK